MPPKKGSKQPSAPVRRSSRLQSRENSKEPSVEPISAPPPPAALVEDTIASPPPPAAPEAQPSPEKKEKKLTTKKKDTAIAKKTGKSTESLDVTPYVYSLINATAKKDKRRARTALTAINGLTLEQREAVLLGLASQAVRADDLQYENKELKSEIEYKNRQLERMKPSIRRDAFLKQLDKYGPPPQSPSQPTPEQAVEKHNITSPGRPLAPIPEQPRQEIELHSPSKTLGPISEQPNQEFEYPGPSWTLGAISGQSSEEIEHISPVQSFDAGILPTAGLDAFDESAAAHLGPNQSLSVPNSSNALVRIENEPARPAAASPWKSIVNSLTGWVPGLRKRKAEDAVEDSPAPKIRVVDSESTPIGHLNSGKKLMRSVKDRTVPSSLSTVTEYTEPPSIRESIPDTTPSKRARMMTPAPMAFTPNTATTTPKSTVTSKPKRTTLSERRRQLNEKQASNNQALPFAWEKNLAKPKPRLPNADARRAKATRWLEVKAEYERMKEDPEVKEIEGVKIKRVNVDSLAVIPHNRPGDPPGCFRVPDYDSDDEIEVGEDVEVTSNIFDESMTVNDHVPANVDSTPKPTFTFPKVAPKPVGYHVTDEFKTGAGMQFARGFAAFISV